MTRIGEIIKNMTGFSGIDRTLTHEEFIAIGREEIAKASKDIDIKRFDAARVAYMLGDSWKGPKEYMTWDNAKQIYKDHVNNSFDKGKPWTPETPIYRCDRPCDQSGCKELTDAMTLLAVMHWRQVLENEKEEPTPIVVDACHVAE